MQWTDNDKKIIVELKNKGMSYRQIGQELGRSRGSISAFITTHKYLFPTVNGLFTNDKIVIREKPNPSNTRIESPPRIVPVIDSKFIPFTQTKPNQCKWICDNGFWDEPHKDSICCGLDVYKRNYCKYHYVWSTRTND